MQQPVETGRRESPFAPSRLERVLLVGAHLRGRHYGQRSCAPHQQVEHMAAPTKPSKTSDRTLPTGSRPHMARRGFLRSASQKVCSPPPTEVGKVRWVATLRWPVMGRVERVERGREPGIPPESRWRDKSAGTFQVYVAGGVGQFPGPSFQSRSRKYELSQLRQRLIRDYPHRPTRLVPVKSLKRLRRSEKQGPDL